MFSEFKGLHAFFILFASLGLGIIVGPALLTAFLWLVAVLTMAAGAWS